MTHALCKYCQAPILWVTTAGGKRMPLNLRPARHGDVLVDTRNVARVCDARELVSQRHLGQTLYVRHAKTCTNSPAAPRLDLGGL